MSLVTVWAIPVVNFVASNLESSIIDLNIYTQCNDTAKFRIRSTYTYICNAYKINKTKNLSNKYLEFSLPSKRYTYILNLQVIFKLKR